MANGLKAAAAAAVPEPKLSRVPCNRRPTNAGGVSLVVRGSSAAGDQRRSDADWLTARRRGVDVTVVRVVVVVVVVVMLRLSLAQR